MVKSLVALNGNTVTVSSSQEIPVLAVFRVKSSGQKLHGIGHFISHKIGRRYEHLPLLWVGAL